MLRGALAPSAGRQRAAALPPHALHTLPPPPCPTQLLGCAPPHPGPPARTRQRRVAREWEAGGPRSDRRGKLAARAAGARGTQGRHAVRAAQSPCGSPANQAWWMGGGGGTLATDLGAWGRDAGREGLKGQRAARAARGAHKHSMAVHDVARRRRQPARLCHPGRGAGSREQGTRTRAVHGRQRREAQHPMWVHAAWATRQFQRRARTSRCCAWGLSLLPLFRCC